MKLVIIESPYAGDINKNINYARACVRDSVLSNEAPIASHLLFTQPGILLDEVPEERTLGINAGLAWLPVADLSAFYTDLGWSSGMLAALHLVITKGLPYELRAINGEVHYPATHLEEVEESMIRHTRRG